MKILFSTLLFVSAVFGTRAQAVDSLDIKIGQMILIGMPDARVDSMVLREVSEGKAGAIIFFEKNIPRTNSFMGLKKMAWTYQQAAPIPLFIAIDQEGGRVNRLKEKYGFPRSVSAAKLGKTGALDSVRFYAESTAATLAGLGINFNFAPVVDLATNPNNPIIAKVERSYSADPDTVATMAAAMIKAHHRVGVLTALKHFPGHGSSKDDTHLGLADVTNTWEKKELVPYQELLDSGYVDAIMTAHIVNRNIDPEGNPGTLSHRAIDSLLRGKLHYQGVVISDDMQMHAITEHYGVEEAIRLAITAGVDILCFSNNIAGSDVRTVDKVHAIIKGYVKTGVISADRIDQSFRRIMNLKRRLSGSSMDSYRGEFFQLQSKLEAMNAKYDSLLQVKPQVIASPAEEKPKKTKKRKH